MTLLESFLIALALIVDSLVVSTTSAFKSKMPYRKGLLMAVVFAVFQGGFPLLGALLGGAFKDFVDGFDHWIAFGLLLLVGGKMIWDTLKGGYRMPCYYRLNKERPTCRQSSDSNFPLLLLYLVSGVKFSL